MSAVFHDRNAVLFYSGCKKKYEKSRIFCRLDLRCSIRFGYPPREDVFGGERCNKLQK